MLGFDYERALRGPAPHEAVPARQPSQSLQEAKLARAWETAKSMSLGALQSASVRDTAAFPFSVVDGASGSSGGAAAEEEARRRRRELEEEMKQLR